MQIDLTTKMRIATDHLLGLEDRLHLCIGATEQCAVVPYDWKSPADLLSQYLHEHFVSITEIIELIKHIRPDGSVREVLKPMLGVVSRIRAIIDAYARRYKVKFGKNYHRITELMIAILDPKPGCLERIPKVFANIPPELYRSAVIDRVIDVIRYLVASMRDALRVVDFRIPRQRPPIRIGAYAASFVVRADREAGVLQLKLQDGSNDFINISPDAAYVWDEIVEPLVASTHPKGLAKLPGGFSSRLTRIDSNGDEKAGDLKRLRLYVHAAGAGRNGTGEFYLANFPRSVRPHSL